MMTPPDPRKTAPADHAGAGRCRLTVYRDDGPIARPLGRLARGRLPALPPLAVAALGGAALLVAGADAWSPALLLVPVLLVLLAEPGSTEAVHTWGQTTPHAGVMVNLEDDTDSQVTDHLD